jgi:hypothetical protein
MPEFEKDAAIAERIIATGLHAFLVDLVDSAGRTQASIARHAGFSEKHVSQMLTGKVDGSLAAWTKLLVAAHGPTRVTSPGGGA